MAPIRQNKLPAANKIFVDREKPHRVFEDAAHAIPTDRSIIRVFYGVGGQGKTALCRELLRRSNPATEPAYAFLRRCELDLHERPKNDPDRLLEQDSLVQGSDSKVGVRLLPVVRKWIYRRDTLTVRATSWSVWTTGVY